MTKYTIKPLEWEDLNIREEYQITCSSLIEYHVWRKSDQWAWAIASETDDYKCNSLGEGKQLAEQHWQERIKACLIEE